MSELIVGIDLGTTNSEVAAFVDGQVKVLGPAGNQILPSCVGFSASGELLVGEAAKHGYGEYRAHLEFMDLAADQYSFGDHAYRRFCESIKNAVDPNGILAPGRHGIWPAAMRADAPGNG